MDILNCTLIGDLVTQLVRVLNKTSPILILIYQYASNSSLLITTERKEANRGEKHPSQPRGSQTLCVPSGPTEKDIEIKRNGDIEIRRYRDT